MEIFSTIGGNKMNLLKRIITALFYIPLLLFIYYVGGNLLFFFLGILCCLGTYEMFKMNKEQKSVYLLIVNIILSLCLFYCFIISPPWTIAVLFLSLLLNSGYVIFMNQIQGAGNWIARSLFSIFYTACGFAMVYKLSETNLFLLLPLIAIMIWILDSAAFFVGMRLGKHRGVFLCSPKKSLEGFLAGIIAILICSIALSYIFPDDYNYSHLIIFTIGIGIFGQFGDLLESILKREMNVKDSSNTLPGHGGILDRFDSLIIAAPVVYFLLELINQCR